MDLQLHCACIPCRLGWPGRSRSGGHTPASLWHVPTNSIFRNTHSGLSASVQPLLGDRAPPDSGGGGGGAPLRPRPSSLQATNEGRRPQMPRPLRAPSPMIGPSMQYLPALARGTGRGEWSGDELSAPGLPSLSWHQPASRATRAAPGRGPRRPDPSPPGLHVANPRWPGAARCPSES